MNALLNYLIEANLGLVFFAAIYWAWLRSEHEFSLKRAYLLTSIGLPLTFPLLHIHSIASDEFVPSLGQVVPTYWLPEIIIHGNMLAQPGASASNVWSVVGALYLIVTIVLAVIFVFQLKKILSFFIRSKKYSWNGCQVCESEEPKPTFSFFRFIFLGQVDKLSQQEKEDILKHEYVHVYKLHSLDIILIGVVGILFWFNPVIRFYKSTLFQLHEFEADAEVVKNKNIDAYCNLLSKLTLDAIGFTLTHHFNNSLTIKRINMMKTMKRNIQSWKLFIILAAVPLLFFLVSCHDQIGQEISKSTVTQVGNYPPEVQAEIEKLKKQHPEQTFTYIEGSREDLIRLIDKAGKFNYMRAGWVWNRNGQQINGALLSNVIGHAEELKMDGEVFTIVEESAAPATGQTAFNEYIATHLKYPDAARTAGFEGKVFVEFIVNPDGTLSDFRIIKSLREDCDQAAINVLSSSPLWIPGKQRGVAVKQRYVLPIVFSMNGNPGNNEGMLESINEKMNITYEKIDIGDLVRWNGTVMASNGTPLPGVNVVIKNHNQGTVTDSNGKFQLDAEKASALVASFVGFQSVEIK